MSAPTALLVGYNGANNTGAEALLQADIADLRAVLGPDAHMTVPTLNAANLRRYLQEVPRLRSPRSRRSSLPPSGRLVREHDLVLLVEGSAYMDTWTLGAALGLPLDDPLRRRGRASRAWPMRSTPGSSSPLNRRCPSGARRARPT